MHGAKVIVSDSAPEQKLAPVLAELGDVVSGVESGLNTVDFLAQADLIVVSPGVPLAIAPLVAVRERGIPVTSEIELASRFVNCPIVGITGSNGKTTTTELCSAMLVESGLSVFTGGNIGRALSELPLSGQSADVAVVELSSFQLEAIETFKPKTAAVLNITEDHMDRYPDFDAYAETKMGLLRVLNADGLAVVNGDDAETMDRCNGIRARMTKFGTTEGFGAWCSGDTLHVNDTIGSGEFDLGGFAPVGTHNRENAMAAVLLARFVGATDRGIQHALDTFKTPPHRIEHVRRIGTVDVYNDSKATSPSSVLTALAAFDRKIVLLLGGRDKGGDFRILRDAIGEKTVATICFGEAAEKIAGQLGAEIGARVIKDLREAMRFGFSLCGPDQVLLLSPGCASFDAFTNYENRGDRFREWASELSES